MVRDLLLIKFGQLLIKEMFFLNKKSRETDYKNQTEK